MKEEKKPGSRTFYCGGFFLLFVVFGFCFVNPVFAEQNLIKVKTYKNGLKI
jgi:hypothetical protein